MKRFWIAVSTVILADQASKWWLLEVVGIAQRTPIELTSFFRLVMVWNEGISFGMLSHGTTAMKWLLITLALGISFWLYRLARSATYRYETIAYGVIVGGALGNVIDRLRFGAVADFFYAHYGAYGWPAFNVADAAITLGVAGLFLLMIRPR